MGARKESYPRLLQFPSCRKGHCTVLSGLGKLPCFQGAILIYINPISCECPVAGLITPSSPIINKYVTCHISPKTDRITESWPVERARHIETQNPSAGTAEILRHDDDDDKKKIQRTKKVVGPAVRTCFVYGSLPFHVLPQSQSILFLPSLVLSLSLEEICQRVRCSCPVLRQILVLWLARTCSNGASDNTYTLLRPV